MPQTNHFGQQTITSDVAGFSFDIFGAKETERNIMSLDKKLGRKIVRKALQQAGKLTLQKAKELVPVRSGNLRSALTLKTPGRYLNESLKEARIYLTIKKNHAMEDRGRFPHYAHLYAFQVEYGTKTTPAHSYMRRAIIMTMNAFIQRIHERLAEEWQKEVVAKGL